jgi:hypothetical protein
MSFHSTRQFYFVLMSTPESSQYYRIYEADATNPDLGITKAL